MMAMLHFKGVVATVAQDLYLELEARRVLFRGILLKRRKECLIIYWI